MPPARGNRHRTTPSRNDQIDPALQEAGDETRQSPSPQPLPHPFTLGSLAETEADANEDQLASPSPAHADPLTDFARQVIESVHMPGHGEEDDGMFHPDHPENAEDVMEAVRAATAIEADEMDERLEKRDGSEHGSGGEGSSGQPTMAGTKRSRAAPAASASTAAAAKRKKGNLNGGLVAEESRDLARMKKDSHKEVERKRRDNINEGIVQIGRLVPGCSDKLGKGQILKLAAQYLSEMTGKDGAQVIEKARGDVTQSKLLLKSQTELAEAQQQLTDEHARSITLETSWREAEDRAAASQFELERVKKELEDAKMQLLENRR